MRKVLIAMLICILLGGLVKTQISELSQEYLNKVRDILTSSTSKPANLLRGCEFSKVFVSQSIPIAEIQSFAGKSYTFTFLGRTFERKLLEVVERLAFTSDSYIVEFENEIVSNGVSIFLAKVSIAKRYGPTVSVRSGVGFAACSMVQQTKSEMIYDERTKKSYPVTSPRGLYMNEEIEVQDYMQDNAAVNLFKGALASLNVGGGNYYKLGVSYSQEAKRLRKWFRELLFQEANVQSVDLANLASSVKQISKGVIQDPTALERIKAVAQSAARSSVFYVPNNDYLFLIAFSKSGTKFNVHVSTFKFKGSMPGGAFASSTGGKWDVEKPGRITYPLTQQLVSMFPPLKY